MHQLLHMLDNIPIYPTHQSGLCSPFTTYMYIYIHTNTYVCIYIYIDNWVPHPQVVYSKSCYGWRQEFRGTTAWIFEVSWTKPQIGLAQAGNKNTKTGCLGAISYRFVVSCISYYILLYITKYYYILLYIAIYYYLLLYIT